MIDYKIGGVGTIKFEDYHLLETKYGRSSSVLGIEYITSTSEE